MVFTKSDIIAAWIIRNVIFNPGHVASHCDEQLMNFLLKIRCPSNCGGCKGLRWSSDDCKELDCPFFSHLRLSVYCQIIWWMTNLLVLIRQLNYNNAIGNELVFSSEFDVKIMNELTWWDKRGQKGTKVWHVWTLEQIRQKRRTIIVCKCERNENQFKYIKTYQQEKSNYIFLRPKQV
jgi:hypothetical protein